VFSGVSGVSNLFLLSWFKYFIYKIVFWCRPLHDYGHQPQLTPLCFCLLFIIFGVVFYFSFLFHHSLVLLFLHFLTGRDTAISRKLAVASTEWCCCSEGSDRETACVLLTGVRQSWCEDGLLLVRASLFQYCSVYGEEETDENIFSLFGNVFTFWKCFRYLFSTFFLVFIFLGAFVDGGGLARKLRVASVQ